MRSHQLRSTLTAVVEWLRAGYPGDAPPAGYSPLLALNGPWTLTQREIGTVRGQLDDGPSASTDIAVAITKATGRLPNPAQVRAVTRGLPQRAD